jgi:hypothetical protein
MVFSMNDKQGLVSGMIGILAICCGLMMYTGLLRGWNEGLNFFTVREPERFIPEPTDPTEAGNWYYWRLPPSEMTPLSGIIVWFCYLAHQFTIWGTIYYAQMKKQNHIYKDTLRNFNYWALGLNLFFHLLHLGQTHWTYDGTAAYVSEASSQGSVIMMLIVILLMEYRDRGILFNWPQEGQKGRFANTTPMEYMRKYHGYAFAWAVIYTFWYHPMEPTWGHAMGFTLTAMLMLQGSLMFTRIHLNKYWRLFLESFVLIHGGVVAYQTGGEKLMRTSLWPMFVFGFGFMFVMTQVHGLPFWNKLPGLCRVIPAVVYFAIVLYSYSWIPNAEGRIWVRMNEIVRIPSLEYLFFFALVGFMLLLLKCFKTPMYEETPTSMNRTALKPILVFMLCYTICIVVSVFMLHVKKLPLMIGMVILVLLYMFMVCVSSLALEHVLHRVTDTTDQEKESQSGNKTPNTVTDDTTTTTKTKKQEITPTATTNA